MLFGVLGWKLSVVSFSKAFDSKQSPDFTKSNMERVIGPWFLLTHASQSLLEDENSDKIQGWKEP